MEEPCLTHLCLCLTRQPKIPTPQSADTCGLSIRRNLPIVTSLKLQDPRPHLCTYRSATITVVSLGHGNQIALLQLFQVFITLGKSIILLLVMSRMILKMGNWYGNIQINTSSLSDIDCPRQKQNYLYQKTTFLKI